MGLDYIRKFCQGVGRSTDGQEFNTPASMQAAPVTTLYWNFARRTNIQAENGWQCGKQYSQNPLREQVVQLVYNITNKLIVQQVRQWCHHLHLRTWCTTTRWVVLPSTNKSVGGEATTQCTSLHVEILDYGLTTNELVVQIVRWCQDHWRTCCTTNPYLVAPLTSKLISLLMCYKLCSLFA